MTLPKNSHRAASIRDGKRGFPASSIGGLLALAYPDRIAKRRTGKGRSYKLASGQGSQLRAHDPLAVYQWLVVASQDVRNRTGHIFIAAPITLSEIQDLFRPELTQTEEVTWNSDTQTVVSHARTRLGELILSEKRITTPSPTAIQKALITGIREMGLGILPWTKDARLLQTRVGCLRSWQPDANWPDLSEETLLNSLESWLSPYLHGVKNIKGCNKLNLQKIFLSRLDYKQQKNLKSMAPTHIQVPSGSKIKLKYQVGTPPYSPYGSRNCLVLPKPQPSAMVKSESCSTFCPRPEGPYRSPRICAASGAKAISKYAKN